MKHIKKLYIAIILVLSIFTISGCSSTPSVPNEDKIKSDLVGKEFWVRGDPMFGGYTYTIKDGAFQSFKIDKRLTDKKDKTDEIYASVVIKDDNTEYIGQIVINYSLYEQGWNITNVKRATDKDMEAKHLK